MELVYENKITAYDTNFKLIENEKFLEWYFIKDIAVTDAENHYARLVDLRYYPSIFMVSITQRKPSSFLTLHDDTSSKGYLAFYTHNFYETGIRDQQHLAFYFKYPIELNLNPKATIDKSGNTPAIFAKWKMIGIEHVNRELFFDTCNTNYTIHIKPDNTFEQYLELKRDCPKYLEYKKKSHPVEVFGTDIYDYNYEVENEQGIWEIKDSVLRLYNPNKKFIEKFEIIIDGKGFLTLKSKYVAIKLKRI